MPFGADTPTPEFVGNSRVRGARSPPGTHGDLTTPSAGTLWAAAGKPTRPVDFSRAKRGSVRRVDFRQAKRESPVGRWTFPEQSGEVCRPPDFTRAKSESPVPGWTFAGQSGEVCPPGKKNRVFSVFFRALRACISGRKPAFFAKKTVDFSARQSDVCPRRAGNRPKGTNRAAGAHADPSCGIHVHVGLGEHTPKTLRNLVNLVNAKEDLLTQALQISPERRSRWCQPVDADFLAALNRRRPATSEEFARIWYDDRDWAYHAHQHYDPSRYHLLNLHSVFQKGTIEFRAFNSTLHAGEVKAYIQLCMAISHQALTVASASPARPVTDNPAYTFRCWLLRLGMNGEEFKTARTHLLKHMPGNAAWRNGAETTRRAS